MYLSCMHEASKLMSMYMYYVSAYMCFWFRTAYRNANRIFCIYWRSPLGNNSGGVHYKYILGGDLLQTPLKLYRDS